MNCVVESHPNQYNVQLTHKLNPLTTFKFKNRAIHPFQIPHKYNNILREEREERKKHWKAINKRGLN